MLFLIQVLSSVIFWALWFGGSFFIGTVLLKHIAPLTFKYITTGKKSIKKGCNYVTVCEFEMAVILLSIYLFWPVFLLGWILKFLFVNILFGLFCSAVKGTDKIIPNIEIKKKE